MFMIESYITPIILNHVAKYVNIRPEDAQVSLWQGAVTFHNLDLRLDVLEEELNLPIELRTGHIHDLNITVPWTRIASEPIKIIINTIEIVMKLRTENNRGSTNVSPKRKCKEEPQKKRLPKEEAENQSILANLANKIINNINVEFNNIIFKYLDEDIVVSMNIQTLKLSSANEKWEPSMIDVNPISFMQRKLLEISDLTICLDNLNAAGQIEVCHEPFLYRCTLQVRVLRKYHVNTVETTSTTRIGVLTKSLDLNISSLQFSLVMRVINFILGITSGQVAIKRLYEVIEEDCDPTERAESGGGGRGGWGLWAWNLLPNLNFMAYKDEKHEEDLPGHFNDIGVYIEELNFTLKNSEYVQDSLLGGTKRIRYHPILRLTFGCLYFERQVVEERAWSSMKMGVSSMCVEPLSTFQNGTKACTNIIECGCDPDVYFTDMSLFDERFKLNDKNWTLTNFEDYNNRITDEYLLYRSPILAFDMIKYQRNNCDENESSMNIPNTSAAAAKRLLQIQYRLLSNGLTFRYNQGWLQVKHLYNDLVNTYDYSAYHAENLETPPTNVAGQTSGTAKLPPPLMEDFDSLMQHVPRKIYKIHLQNITIEFHAQTEPLYDWVKPTTLPLTQPQPIISHEDLQNLPFFQFHVANLQGTLSSPLDPDKLVHTTCQLPEKPKALLDACYNIYEFAAADVNMTLRHTSEHVFVELMQLSKIDFQYQSLIQPHLWDDKDAPMKRITIECPQLSVTFTKRELYTSLRLLQHIGSYQPTQLMALAKHSQQKLGKAVEPRLQNKFQQVVFTELGFKQQNTMKFTVYALLSDLFRRSEQTIYHVLDTTPAELKAVSNWLNIQIQVPTATDIQSDDDTKLPNHVFAIWLGPYRLQLDKHILEFLAYRDEVEYIYANSVPNESELRATRSFSKQMSTESILPAQQQYNFNTMNNTGALSQATATGHKRRGGRLNSYTRKISHPEETIHLSSERDEVARDERDDCRKTESFVSIAKPAATDTQPDYLARLNYLKRCILNIEMDASQIDIAEELKQNNRYERTGSYTRLRLPKVSVKSVHADEIARGDLCQKLAFFHKSINTVNITIELINFEIMSVDLLETVQLLAPTKISITLAMEHRREQITTSLVKRFVDTEPQLKQQSSNISNASVKSMYFTVNDDEDVETGLVADLELADTGSKTQTTQPTKRQISLRDVVTINLHIDVRQIHFYMRQLQKLHNDLSLLNTVLGALSATPVSADYTESTAAREQLQIVTADEENATIKEFLEFETNSDVSIDHCDASLQQAVKMTWFAQCSIAKITIEVENTCDKSKRQRKLVFDFEDMLSTLDKQIDFTKCTAKMGNFTLNLYELSDGQNWQQLDDICIKMLCGAENLPMFNVIITTVAIEQLYKKIGAKSRSGLRASTAITEIIVNMQEVDIILDLDVMYDFLQANCPLFDLVHLKRTNAKESRTNKPLTAADIPMLHLESMGVTLYLPLRTSQKSCNVTIWKVEHMRISPNLENPLQRNVIRTDVFSKAAQMGILGTPGAIVEDRQYELTFKNLYAASGNWDEVLTHMRKQTTKFQQHTNPALEWNSQNENAALQLAEIFTNFTFVAIYAPTILYKNILICGQAIEINCTSDFIAKLHTFQINLLSYTLLRLNNINCLVNTELSKRSGKHVIQRVAADNVAAAKAKSLHKPQSQLLLPLTQASDDNQSVYLDAKASVISFPTADDKSIEMFAKSDSGYSSKQQKRLQRRQWSYAKQVSHSHSQLSVLQEHQNLQTSHQPERNVPHSLSLLAGLFVINIFDVQQTNASTQQSALSYKPLLTLTMIEPSYMFKQNIIDSITQISLFDLSISIASLENADCMEMFLATAPGQPNSSGIPSPLITYKSQSTNHKKLEVEIDITKSIIFSFTEHYIQHCFSNLLRIYSALIEDPCFNRRSTQHISRGSKIQLMRERCLNADRLHVVCQRIEFKLTNMTQYKCRLVCADLNANIKFMLRPEKAVLKAAVGTIYLQTDQKICVHPIAFRLSADFVSETWHRLPLVLASIKFNIVHVDVDVDVLLQLRAAGKGLERITSYMSAEFLAFLKNRPPLSGPNMANKQLNYIKMPSCERVGKKLKIERNEYYQDDLRAGAFQFVEVNTDAVLPLPYQIQIIKKDFGIICWRYPQPRKMFKINIFPVPMAVENPIQIKCRMEYYSELFDRFVHYCDFYLSETHTREVQLPEYDICATIWRVVIMQALVSVNGECFENSEEDEELHSVPNLKIEQALNSSRCDADFVLHPKVLVACMRVDTTFQSKFVPKVQLMLSCNELQVKLLNPTNQNAQLPALLRPYHLTKTTATNQAFLILQIERSDFYAAFYNPQHYTLDSSLNVKLKCLDYGFLNMLPLLEPTKLQFYASINKPKRKIAANLLIDKMRLNIGPAVLQTLLASKAHWHELLNASPAAQSKVPNALLPKCVVVNRTNLHLAFGQTGTSERIELAPLHCQLYYFCSDSPSHSQELTFVLTDEQTLIREVSQSVAIPFKYEGDVLLQNVRIADKCLVIKLRKLSTTQVIVFVKGQVELVSMVPHELGVQFRYEDQLNANSNMQEYKIHEQSRASFYQPVQRWTNINMRLRLNGDKGRGRTGDIPLKANKNLPWLVKVPIEPDGFISFWVRVLREDIKSAELETDTFQPQKILITVWPIFDINNRLNCSIGVLESSTNKSYAVEAAGGSTLLDLPATHLSEHRLDFDFSNIAVTANTLPHYTLMLKSLDWHKFFKYDESVWHIEEALHKLALPSESKWPIDSPEELRMQRHCTNKVPIDVSYKCRLSREFACSMSLEVSPWGIFVNATGLDISICDYETKERLPVAANNLEMMFAIAKVFTIDIQRGSSWKTSMPIIFNDTAKQSKIRKEQHILLQDSVATDVTIMLGEVTVKCLLTFARENDLNIFKLSPKIIVTNFLQQTLSLLPFALDHKESTSREELQQFDKRMPKFHIKPASSTTTKTTQDYIGLTLDAFFDVHANKSKRSKDTAFVCFVCIKAADDMDCSIPLSLALPFTRRCLSIQNGLESIPLVVTLIEKDSIFYLNIFRDTSPTILINNYTDVALIVAQSSASENSQVTNVTSEYEGRHFEWFQLIPAGSEAYYTPPELASGFSDSDLPMCNLTLALYHAGATKKTIKWSKPIRTDKAWKKFLHLPSHGDIKVLICDKHRVIRVSIHYISQQSEFSVKDLRSRILTLTPTLDTAAVSSAAQQSLQMPDTASEASAPNECLHFREDCSNKIEWKVRLFAKALSLTLHTDDKERDYIKQEIFAVHIDDLAAAADDNEDENVWDILFGNVQIDNQLHSLGKYDFPVVLCAQQLYTRTPQTAHVHDLNATYQHYAQMEPMMHFKFQFYLDERKLSDFNCKLSPVRVYIEDAFVNDFLEALVEYSPMNCVYKADEPQQRLTLAAGETLLPSDIAATAFCIAEPLKLRTFCIEPLSVLLSVHTSLRLYIALDHSPLSFSKYVRQHVLTMPLRFGQSLGLHYLSGAIFGAGWVVGSLEILGSPSGLARSVTTGLRDFVSMPMEGLFRGPWGFIVGITQGSASLFRNVTAGTVNSVTKLASSVARNLDRLSLDKEHIERTEALRRLRPQGFAQGLTQGLTGFGISLLGAVGGIAHHTLEANSAFEFLAGVSKGLVGVITKPISGAAELVALTGQGMLHTVGFNTMPQQYAESMASNIAVEPSAYRIWKLLPGELLSDQVLVYNEVTLLRNGQMRRAYAFLTLAVFAIIEAEWDRLALALPVDKVDIRCDPQDNTLLFVRMLQEPQDDIEENFNYTNQRIMNFLQSSEHPMTTDSLHELLQTRQQNHGRNMDWSFYIDAHIGEHLMQYIKIMKFNVKKIAKM